MLETTIAGAFCELIGFTGLWTGLRQLKNRRALEGWQTTRGKVVERGTYQPDTPTRSAPAFRHAALVKYAYQVGGREFINDSIRPKRLQLPQHSTRKWARALAESFADEVTVHYNPADPRESYLILTPKRTLYLVIVVSCLVILFGLTFFVMK